MSETELRLFFFLGILILMAFWEFCAPRRAQNLIRARRWPSNLALSCLNIVVLRFALPFSAMTTAIWAHSLNFGLLQNSPYATPLAIIFLDLAIYLQHILFHKIPLLWRIHAMHHSDTELDVTTGLRFHPLEALLSMLFKCGCVLLLGAPPLAVMIFEILLNACALFSHSNISPPFEKFLRLFFVTPHMHAVHHSPLREETDSNYGNSTSLWDRVFKTYRAVSLQSNYGLETLRAPEDARLDKLLIQPFK